MANIPMDGNVRVAWATTITNTSSPANAEITAGVDLSSWITPDGLNFGPVATGKVDMTNVASTQNTSAVGRRDDGDPNLILLNQGYAAAPWTTFNGNPYGFIVIRRGILGSTAWTAGQKVFVYPVQAGYRSPASYAANTAEKFTQAFLISGVVIDNATVA